MRPLADHCQPRDSIFDKARRDTVLDLTDLVQSRIDPEPFFRENHIVRCRRRHHRQINERMDRLGLEEAAAETAVTEP